MKSVKLITYIPSAYMSLVYTPGATLRDTDVELSGAVFSEQI